MAARKTLVAACRFSTAGQRYVILATMLDYDQQKSVHEEIVSLYPRIAEAKCYFRTPSFDTTQQAAGGTVGGLRRAFVDRDRAICAIVNKLVTTQCAIFLLCESNMGDDAYALSRVALENAVIIAWLLNEEQWCKRIDIYANSYSQAKVRLDAVAQKHHGGTEAARSLRESITSEDNAIVEELFDGRWQEWARVDGKRWTFKEMAEEVFENDFFYDRIFLETSWFVHSGLRSCLDILGELGRDDCYSLKVRYNKNTATYALFLANTAVLVALTALDRRTPIGLSAQIDGVFARFRESGHQSG